MTLQDKIYHTEQMANAIQRREEFYDIVETPITTFSKVRHIELPTPQVAGTMTQQRSYAMDKAMDIIESISL
tara:strand:- start:1025 stop:1240 length:216 start_codon:yes stop_codon:yes gene_type:complete